MVTIETLKPDHFDLVARWLSNRDLNRWLSAEWRKSELKPATIAITVRNQRNRLFLVRKDSEACGIVGFAEIDLADRTAMLWYVLGETRLSGQGIISEAIRQLARTGFAEMGLASIYAWIMEENIASRKVLQKASFREAGRLRRTASLDGRQIDRLYFDLIGSET